MQPSPPAAWSVPRCPSTPPATRTSRAGGFVLAVAHDTGLEIVIAMTLIGIGVGLVYAMLAKLIIDAVEPAVTGVAMGMNTVMRTIGGVIGGQVGAAILSSQTIPGTPEIPQESAFTITFLIAGAIGVLGALGCLRIPRRPSAAPVEAPRARVAPELAPMADAG
jgi:hypothetical protein